MQPSFIIDTQLPPRLAIYLDQRGFDAKHTIHYPSGYFIKDQEILEIAKKEGRIVISKDSDFLDNFIINGSPPKVIFLKLGNCSNRDLFSYFEKNIEELIKAFSEGVNMIVVYPKEFRVY